MTDPWIAAELARINKIRQARTARRMAKLGTALKNNARSEATQKRWMTYRLRQLLRSEAVAGPAPKAANDYSGFVDLAPLADLDLGELLYLLTPAERRRYRLARARAMKDRYGQEARKALKHRVEVSSLEAMRDAAARATEKLNRK